MRGPLAQEQEERRLGEALDAGEDAPAAAVVVARTRGRVLSRRVPLHVKHTCKTTLAEPGRLRKRRGSRAIVGGMRVTKVGTMRVCAICERTLLMGERAVRFAPEEGAELVDVCPLCQEIARRARLDQGRDADDADVPGDRKRRRRGFGELLGLAPRRTARPLTPPEPILRRLSERRGRAARGRRPLQRQHLPPHGRRHREEPRRRRRRASSRSRATPASWRSPSPGTSRGTSTASARTRPSRSGSSAAATSSTSSRRRFKEWNAHVEDDGRLVPEIARL